MRTALDSSVILDVLANDPEYAERSAAAIRKAASEGALVVSPCALAEVLPACPERSRETLLDLVKDWQIEIVPSDTEAALEAGEKLQELLEEPGRGQGMLPLLLIAGHALHHADRLLSRRSENLKRIMTNLEVVEP